MRGARERASERADEERGREGRRESECVRLTELLSAASEREGRERGRESRNTLGWMEAEPEGDGQTEREERKLLLWLLWLLPPSLHLLSEGSLAQLACPLSPSPHSLLGSHSPSLQMLLVEGNRQSSVAHSSSFLPSFFRAHWLARSLSSLKQSGMFYKRH